MKNTSTWEVGCTALTIAATLSCAPRPALAEDYIVTIGGRVGMTPPYEGAGHDIFSPSPNLNIRRADHARRFTPSDDGSTAALLSTRHFDFGPVLRFRYERGDTDKLEGFQKINVAVEPGVFMAVWPTDWLRGRIEARHGFIGYDGYVGDAGIDVIHTGNRWDFSIGPRIGYGDNHYIDTYFGVTPEEAEHSPFIKTPYEPGAGQRYVGLETAYSYHLNDHWRTIVDFGYHRLAHRAADSPLVEIAGSRDQYSASLGFSYSFGLHIGKKSEPAS